MNPTTVAHLQLSALRRMYPAWEFVRGMDEAGGECWQMRLCVEITPPMRNAGIVEVVERSDYDSLAYELRRQEAILRPFRATRLNPRRRAYTV
ncbi:hypothetical protein [Nonomuraea basaltis]|uniref:hypothetical protein n=1 Tax=Nonomuraea basaltis TaxID=2495887 RepID=UPI00110C65CC|nr:hypothetical protein [Nonomuraea basaltis]TMR99498.1 hypothetical protein EJK15_06705 [Nonomuraea basaltis]